MLNEPWFRWEQHMILLLGFKFFQSLHRSRSVNFQLSSEHDLESKKWLRSLLMTVETCSFETTRSSLINWDHMRLMPHSFGNLSFETVFILQHFWESLFWFSVNHILRCSLPSTFLRRAWSLAKWILGWSPHRWLPSEANVTYAAL